jgi:hypothetical protein
MAEAVSVLAQLKQRKPSPQIVATPKTAFEQEVDEDLLLEGTDRKEDIRLFVGYGLL